MTAINNCDCDSTAKTESTSAPVFGTLVSITSNAALFEGEATEERQHAEEFLALCVSQSSQEDISDGVNSPTCSSTHLYDGVDDVLNIQDEEDSLALEGSGSEVNLYDSVVMGNNGSFEDGSQTEEGQLSQDEFSPNGKSTGATPPKVVSSISNTAGYPIKKIPDAYTDDLADEGLGGSPPQMSKRYSETGMSMSGSIRPRRHAVYIGNLTWWTTDEDITSALHSVGVVDIVDIKFIDCRTNGQSKGFCLVTFKTETSVAMVFEKVAGIQIHDQTPLVKPDTKQSLILLDSQAKTRPVPNSSMSMGSSGGGSGIMCGGNGSRNGLTHSSMGSNYGMPNRAGGASGMRQSYTRGYGYRIGQGYRNGGPINANAAGGFYGYSSSSKPHRPMGMPIRGPPPHVVMSNSYGSVQYDEWYRPSPYSMVRSGPVVVPPFPHLNPAFRGPRFSLPNYGSSSDGLYHGFYETDQVYLETPGILSNVGQEESVPAAGLQGSPVAVTSPFRRPTESHSSPVTVKTEYTFNETDLERDLDEDEIDEMLSRNSTVSTAAIKRAVKDASSGEYASAIETLVTAISLLKSSKIARDKRCAVLISSLQDTLEGIEHRSYGRKDTSDSERKSRIHRSRNRDRSPNHRRNSISIDDRHRERNFTEDNRSGRTSRRSWEERDRGYLDAGEKVREYEQERAKVRRVEIERDDRVDSYRRNH